MNGWKLWKAEWRSIVKNPRVLIPILAVALVPLMYAGMFLWAFWDPYGQMKDLPVAIVNEDEGATFNGDSLAVGDELVDKLLTSEAFDFIETTKAEAETGLENHDYYMAIEIPKDFSAKATTALDELPEQLELTYIANESYNFLAAQIGGSAMEQVKAELSTEVAKQYVSAMRDGIDEVAVGLEEAADGAAKLADGSKTAEKGATELADGTALLASKQQELADGAGQLGEGVSQLATGTIDLADGSQQVYEGSAALSDGADRVNEGASDLLDGTNRLVEGTTTFASKLEELYAGAKSLDDGVQTLAAGVEQAKAGSAQLVAGSNELANGMTNAKQGNAALLAGEAELIDGIDQMKTTLLASQDELMQQLSALVASGQPIPPDVLQQVVSRLEEGKQATTAGFDELTIGAERIRDGQTELGAGLTKAEAGANALASGLAELDSGQTELADGAAALATGSGRLEQGAKTAMTSSGELASASTALNAGVGQLRDGTSELASGSTRLTEATGTLTEGSKQLAAGAKDAETGTRTLTEGAMQLADGGKTVASGSSELRDGLSELESGNVTLRDALAEGAEQASIELGDENVDMMAGPVKVVDASIHHVPNYGTGFAPYFMSLGLFVGALLLSIVYPLYDPAGKPKRSLSWLLSKSGVLVVVGFVQALVLNVAMVQLLGLDVDAPLRFFGFSWLVSITFLLIVQLLVTTLGNPGRFVAIVLLILQLTTSAGTFPLELIPKALQPFNAVLPMTYTVAGYKEILSGDGAQYLQSATSYLTVASLACFLLLWGYFRMAWKKKYRVAAAEA
ncbi:YhgE/Pip domain-containing protein [Exiguobacterium alkaliphilum]|uniref:YhgE/Pip domain-containing protein n=1 Tax=Exiguobacterium alkaliphilum TaxID=1428684 RepID=A0ABT2KY65_9BACL|nr:YhgE/Pip domain-containing protein [Exiguobacterium alkaliphilum]MCT4795877.1 YhgE/Pip domain-containing protein [Exiguobacterium alkaliphilum]